MFHKSISCDGRCGASLTWDGLTGLTRASMEQAARNQGWHAPDRLGQHWCLNCRSRAGAAQWWRKENVRRGLPAGYGLGTCTCAKHGPGRKLDPDCTAAGHPGVIGRL